MSSRLLEVVRCTIPVNWCTAHVQDELAQQVIKAMCRKFAGSAKVALRAYGHAARAGDAEGARRALDRSLTSLQKRKHIKARHILSSSSSGRGALQYVPHLLQPQHNGQLAAVI